MLIEQSLIGESYIQHFRRACTRRGIRIVDEEWIAQTAQDVTPALERLNAAKRSALVHCGFGFGLVYVNPALEALGWDPPRFMGTAFQNAWINDAMWNAIVGWVGLDQYDEGNEVGQRFLDGFEAAYGRRPQYCVPVMNRDVATGLLYAFSEAHPLSPKGVRDALEKVKMVPAAAGAPGTRISFGRWSHRGWMGAGSLARCRRSHLVSRRPLWPAVKGMRRGFAEVPAPWHGAPSPSRRPAAGNDRVRRNGPRRRRFDDVLRTAGVVLAPTTRRKDEWAVANGSKL